MLPLNLLCTSVVLADPANLVFTSEPVDSAYVRWLVVLIKNVQWLLP